MAYTDIDKPSDYFNTILYTGTGSELAVTGVGFQPDWIWFKQRDAIRSNALVDSVRGRSKVVFSDLTNAEETSAASTNDLVSFDSDGFTVGITSASGSFNTSSGSHVAWNWKAGTSFTNDASATGIGSIDSTGSASDVSGFSIVSFTGTGSNGTIKHGLSTAPSMVIIKRRDATNDWRVGSSALTNWVKHINLNTTAAESDLAVAFNSTAPTSSVFSVGTSISVNASGGTYIAYCFSNIQGYSKVGSYTGNGGGAANGNFIYTGFSPAFVMIKNTTHTYNWVIQDNKRNTFNPLDRYIYPNTSDAEAQNSIYDLDLLSNGFKVRSQRSETNDTNNGYIFMCFAENPFVTSTGVPATAR
jgi:hypothetical protein